MAVYEFQTAVNDGIINIPAEYRDKILGKIKVILVSEENDNEKTLKKLMFPYFAVDTTGYIFDREEANER